jgi:outer membrane protein assembly factor BamA
MGNFMYKNIIVILLLCSTMLNASLFDNNESDSKNEIVLASHSFEVVGNKYLKKSAIYDALGVDNKSFYEFWKEDNPQIKDKLIPILSTSIRAFLDSEGFYDATFKIEKTTQNLKVIVEENKPIKVLDINITSDYNISSLMSFKKGEIFRAKKFINLKTKIAKKLLEDGYCSNELDIKAYVDLKKHIVNMAFHLSKGGICTFGNVTIRGNKTIDDDAIMSRVVALEGSRFSTKLLKDTSDGLYGLQSFDSVLINVDRKFYNVIPVDITVKEMERPYHFEVGVGYDSYVGARVHASVKKHNFLGDAKQLELKLAWSKQEQLIMVNTYRPVFFTMFGLYFGYGASAGYSNLEYDGFQEDKDFLKAYLDYKSEYLNIMLGFESDIINIHSLDNLTDGEELQFAVNEGKFVLIYPFLDITYDKRDSKLNPKYGYYLRYYGEFGLSDEETTIYHKSRLEARAIYSIGDLTLATVGILGVVKENGKDTLPESKYFFAGGSFSNRAYGFRELGVIISNKEDTINGASSWGNLVFEGKIESLKHYKDDVSRMDAPQECGIKFAGFDDIKEGDELEFYIIKKVPKKLTFVSENQEDQK